MDATGDEPHAEWTTTSRDDNVRAFSTRPDRFVFVMSGHTDAWIASDLLVPIHE